MNRSVPLFQQFTRDHPPDGDDVHPLSASRCGRSKIFCSNAASISATKRRDRKAALKFLKRTMKRYGRPGSIVTDRLRSYRAAMKSIGIATLQECGRWRNNRAENSHQPFRRREGAMTRFRDIKTLQKFAAAHASIHNHFNHDRHLNRRDIFKEKSLGCFGRVASTRRVKVFIASSQPDHAQLV